MNSASIKIVRLFISSFFFFGTIQIKAWEVDLSRRQMDFEAIKDQPRGPSAVIEKEIKTESILETVLDSTGPTQDIVIMNTENGFVPETIKVKKGHNYRIHVINVNEKQKNVSFTFDAFSENHNTLFGKPRIFSIQPKVEGVFSFNCPETEVQGKMVIISEDRKVASEK